jgi:hypothetical protein
MLPTPDCEIKSDSVDSATTISVVDFRRNSMVLQWHALGGTWTAYDTPPALVHGIALIRPAGPNICVYGQDGQLHLQIGPNQYVLSESTPRISCARGLASFGFRRRFSIKSGSGGLIFSHSYWTHHGRDFFRWLANKAENPDWRIASGRQWSDGVASQVLRPS